MPPALPPAMLDRLTDRLALFAAALWWGGLTVVSFIVVPQLFQLLPTRALAGPTAAHMFASQVWVSLLCGLALLLCLRGQQAQAAAKTTLGLVALGMLLALVQQYGIAPRILTRSNPPLWHGLGTALVVLQWLCVAAVLWRVGGRR